MFMVMEYSEYCWTCLRLINRLDLEDFIKESFNMYQRLYNEAPDSSIMLSLISQYNKERNLRLSNEEIKALACNADKIKPNITLDQILSYVVEGLSLEHAPEEVIPLISYYNKRRGLNLSDKEINALKIYTILEAAKSEEWAIENLLSTKLVPTYKDAKNLVKRELKYRTAQGGGNWKASARSLNFLLRK